MIQIVLRLGDLSDTELEARLRALALAQTNNPTAAPGLTITAADFTTAADLIKTGLAEKEAARDAAISATTDKNSAVQAGLQLIRDYAPDVLEKSGQDPAKIQILGLEVRDTSAPHSPTPSIAQVPVITLDYGPVEGSMIAKSSPMERTHGIEFDVNLTPNAAPTWQHWLSVSSTPVTLTGLPPGGLAQVRGRGIFADGPGPWSTVVEHRAA